MNMNANTSKKHFVIVKRAITTFVLLIIFAGQSTSQVLQSIEVDFLRIFESSTAADTAGGTIYYQKPDGLTVKVTNPLNQWMIFKGSQLDIYYPDDKMAYRIFSQYPSSLPFFQAFVGVVREDYGLTEMGYEMSSYTSSGDTLATLWNPPAMSNKILGPYRLNFVADKIIYAEISDAEGNITARSFYSDHLKSGSAWFPLTIKTVRYVESDSTVETVSYSNPKFNLKLPQEITDFHIPENTNIIETEW